MKAPKVFRTRSTSPRTAKLDPIVLRTGERSRLVFIPVLVQNDKNPNAGLNGTFVYQRKAAAHTWIDLRTIPLDSLKSGEGYALRLASAELLHFFEQIQDAYDLRREKGTPSGQRTYIETTALKGLGQIGYDAIARLLDSDTAMVESFIPKVVQWLATSPQAVDAVERMMASRQLPDLNARLSLASLKATLTTWRENEANNDEDFWQQLLASSTYVLSQILSFPLVVIRAKAYLGGKGIDNRRGKYTDFLAANALTRSAVIVEIKTPLTPLLCGEYRDNVFPFSEELSGAVAQVLHQKRTFLENHPTLYSGGGPETSPAGTWCVVIVGHIGRQLGSDTTLKENLEMQRQSLHGVTILTYDELFRKLEDLIRLIENQEL